MLLDKGWHGPHGYYGRWTMEGDILGYKRPIKTGIVRRNNKLEEVTSREK
jgi:hypothetical protein